MRYFFLPLALLSSPLLAENLLPPTTAQESVYLIDPEPPEVSTRVVVTEPPAQIRLPIVISDKKQWRGVQCAVTEFRLALFKHPDKWESFWKRGLAPYSPRLADVPAVDFSQDMVVGVFLGEKKYPFSEIEIRSAKVETQRDGTQALVIRYREIRKMSGVFMPEFPVQPFHLRRIPIFDGPVRFIDLRKPSAKRL